MGIFSKSSPLNTSCESNEINTSTCSEPCAIEECSVPPCPENHCTEIVITQFSNALQIRNEWVVPECGGQATILVSNLVLVHPGSFLWSAQYGYFEIMSLNEATGQLTVQNNCDSGNAAPGTTVAACTTFIVSDPPCVSITVNNPYVAEDFIAPNNGDCVVISVTNTEGLVEQSDVYISTGVYRVNSIVTPTTIEICNDGAGLIGGTEVIAIGVNGELQYPIIPSNTTTVTSNTGNATPDIIDSTNLTIFAAATLSIPNPSSTRSMHVFYSVTGNIYGSAIDASGNLFGIQSTIAETVDGVGPVTVRDDRQDFYAKFNTATDFSREVSYSGVDTVAPGGTFTLLATFNVLWTGDATASYDVSQCACKASAIAAVP